MTTQQMAETPVEHPSSTIRVGAVAFLNTLPLIEGLAKMEGVELTLTAPNELIGLLERDEVDIALASSIDYQRSPIDLAIVPGAGMIGCAGPTMTVRVFSQVPPEEITTIAADVDSHTSRALAAVILAEKHGRSVELVDFDADQFDMETGEWPRTLLLIGDKVVTSSPPAIRYPHQFDLGEAWHELTGLPFVYAAWMCRAEHADTRAVRDAAIALGRQRRRNAQRLGWIVDTRAAVRHWPKELAREYLAERLRFDLDDDALKGLDRFYDLAHAHGLINERREVRTAGA